MRALSLLLPSMTNTSGSVLNDAYAIGPEVNSPAFFYQSSNSHQTPSLKVVVAVVVTSIRDHQGSRLPLIEIAATFFRISANRLKARDGVWMTLGKVQQLMGLYGLRQRVMANCDSSAHWSCVPLKKVTTLQSCLYQSMTNPYGKVREDRRLACHDATISCCNS